MDDLLAFVHARLDEDEHAARRAASLCGCHPDAPSWVFGDETTEGRILVVEDPHPQVKRKLNRRWGGSYDGLFMAQHIVRHDPARVLREVEAKRRIVATYTEVDAHPNRLVYGFMQQQWVALRAVIAGLALPYSDHLDYREEWKP